MPDEGSTSLERALAGEILAVAARKRLSHKHIQQEAGITDRSFRRWFVECTRHIPISQVARVAEVLGMPLSDLLELAETELEK